MTNTINNFKEIIFNNINSYFKSDKFLLQVDADNAEASVFCVKRYNLINGDIEHQDFGDHIDPDQDIEELVEFAIDEIINCYLDEAFENVNSDEAFDLIYEVENI